jgi:hypothetical protein
VLELVEGEDLGERLRRGPIPVDEAIRMRRRARQLMNVNSVVLLIGAHAIDVLHMRKAIPRRTEGVHERDTA